MSNKTRKHIWPVSVVMSIAIIGALAALLVLVANPANTQAHEPATGQTHAERCATQSAAAQGVHDAFTAPDHPDCVTDDGNGNGNGDNGMMGDTVHATMPMDFQLEGLDNGARLSWEMPKDVAEHATIYGYQIDRDAWNELASHPINMYGDARFKVGAHYNNHSDLGLAYETVYTYMVRAVVQYNVEGWWNMLNCVEMNDAVTPTGDEPAVGADTDGTTYCKMYDDLSAEATVVVQRAYAALDYKAYTYYGEWSMMRTTETADSGGRLAALLDTPSAVRMIRISAACAETITVRWREPMYFGTVPAMDQNGVYVGPDYIGGRRAGLEEVGEAATGVTYQVQRMVNNGAWTDVTSDGMSFTDMDVAYDNTYKYRVRAMNGIGLLGPWSMDSRMLVEPPGVSAPSNLRATLNEEGEVVLQWTAPQGGNQEWFVDDDLDVDVNNGDKSSTLAYRVERVDAQNNDTDNFGTPTEKHQYGPRSFDTPRITHEQTRTDPDPYDGEVTYVVTALVNDCLPSEGNSVTLDTQISAPGTPGNVNAAVSGSMITVTWTAPSDAGSVGSREASITGYNVERSTMSGSGFETVVSGNSGTSYTDSGLDYDTTYYYRVIAVNSFGAESGASAESSAATAAEIMALTAPSGVTVSALQNTISVTWDTSSIENADQIKVALFDSGVTTIVDLETFNAASDPGAATFTGVDAGSYKVVVASFRTGDPHMLSSLMDVTIQ